MKGRSSVPLAVHLELERGLRDLDEGVPDREVLVPIPIYRLNLDTLVEAGSVISQARKVGWRFILKRLDGTADLVDVVDAFDNRPVFGGLSRGPRGARLLQAMDLAAAVSTPDQEVRALDIPALNASALWLSPSDATFIPYDTIGSAAEEGVRVVRGYIETAMKRASALAAIYA